MPKPTIEERKQHKLDKNKDDALEAFGGVCICCGSTDESTFVFVVHVGDRLKALDPTANTLGALARQAPANSELRCGNCFARFNLTGECVHE